MDVLFTTLYSCQKKLCARLQVALFVVMNKIKISYTLFNIIFVSMRVGLVEINVAKNYINLNLFC